MTTLRFDTRYGPRRSFAALCAIVFGWTVTALGFALLGAAVALADPPRSPVIAIVIDDVGLNAAAAQRVIDLPAPITVSLLAYAPNARAIDERARAAGHETFVHLPMEPIGMADPGAGAVTTWMRQDEIARRASAAFDAAPGATGFNNHMGSRFTQCAECLRPVLAEARLRGLYALDSLTDPRSVLRAEARAAGLDALDRDVFLDDERTRADIARQLARAERIARERGYAVAIGHPHAETLSALEAWMPEAEARGFDVSTVRAALERRDGPRLRLRS